MKVMDLPNEDPECQVDVVILGKQKKSKQARLPFQTLHSDSPLTNKKRKQTGSPDCRNAKQPKVNTKENSIKSSKETSQEDIVIFDEKDVEETEENVNGDVDMKDTSKSTTVDENQDSKSKKNTPGKSSTKSRKSETKVQANSLTKFFKKIESKNKETSTCKDKDSVQKDSEINKSHVISEDSKVQIEQNETDNETKNVDKVQNTHVNEELGLNNKKSEESKIETDTSDSESKDKLNTSNNEELNESSSNNENEEGQADISVLNVTDNMDVDSDDEQLDNSNDEDDCDSNKSETGSKKSDQNDEDKDNPNKNIKFNLTTPTRKKIFNCSVRLKKLTPKQEAKKLEIQKRRESKMKEKMEKEKKLQEERENKKREKEEKRREKEEKDKVLKEQKRKEKELKDLKKQAEIEQKQKEKEAKEEDRRKREEAKEEERKRKEEEKLEAERKKLKAASNFVSFFVPKKPTDTKPVEEETKVEPKYFMPFEIKADMRVAPLVRRNFPENEKAALDKLIINSDLTKSKLYINELKNKQIDIRKSGKTWPFEANDDVVILDEDEEESSNIVQPSSSARAKYRAKLLMFSENRRPPYWGTWRKKSKNINPRRPFATDSEFFDYEIDSDEEWEEEEEGESLRGSDDEKEKDEDPEDNEYDVDNDFMVPHGYLSEEEIGAEDEEDEDDELNPEAKTTKLKILGEQFEAERNTKTKKLKPKVIGCYWMNKNNEFPENTPAYAVKFLTTRQAWVREIPLVLSAPADAENLNDECGTPLSKSGAALSARKAQALEEAIPDLIRLLHGNTHSRFFLLKEFFQYWSKKHEGEKAIPKAKLMRKIREIALWTPCPDPGPMHEKYCWYVSQENRTKYLGLEQLTLPNRWTYCLTPKKRSIVVETPDKPEEKEKEKEKEKKTVPLITQFTKTLTSEELQKQLTEKTSTPTIKPIDKPSAASAASKPITPSNRQPKRATLISVPRGEPISKSPRISLMDKFITKDNLTSSADNKLANKPMSDDLDDDDCMIIDNCDDEQINTISTSLKANDVEKRKED